MKKKTRFKKIKVGIIGTGNIGSDLLVKVQRSQLLECSIFTGKNPDSEGIKRAKKMGVKTSFESIKAIEKNPQCCEIVFDATSAESHLYNAPILKRLKKFVIDMTPSRIGKMCVPILNLESSLKEHNINMVSCGGQATTPIAKAIMKINPDTEYIEIVSSISSKSAGKEVLVDELPLPTRTINALKKQNINTLGALAEKTDEQISDIKNLGEKSIEEIKKLLVQEGYR